MSNTVPGTITPDMFIQNGQQLQKESETIPRQIVIIVLKKSLFAYDLWEWKYNGSKQVKDFELSGLYHEGIRQYLESLQYYKRYLAKGTIVYIMQESNIIDEITCEMISDAIKDYIDNYTNTEINYNKRRYAMNIEPLRNIWLKQSNNIINNRWLTNMNTHNRAILKDTKDMAFMVFNNCYYEITKDDIIQKPLHELKHFCIWRKQVINRDFDYKEKYEPGEFEKFAFNVCNQQKDRFDSLRSLIGYLLHDYFNPTEGKAAILYDEALTSTDRPQGGTGKGLIAQAIKQVRSTTKIDGKSYDTKDKFKWSNVTPFTQVVWIDETNNKFDFKDLFSCLTDGWQVERKYANKFDIDPADSPKVLICSNQVLPIEGNSFLRRQFIVELSDYYSKKIITGTEKPIEDEHGILFSNDWKPDEWTKFYSFMIECLKFFLQHGLCNYNRKNVHLNRLRQNTSDDFYEYITKNKPPINKNFGIRPLFEDFKELYYGDDSKFTQRTFTNWLKKYAIAKGYEWKYVGKEKAERLFIMEDVDKGQGMHSN